MLNKLTIIIPIYNVKKEILNKCFLSVKNQTNSFFNIIIVINGKSKLENFIKNKFKNYSNCSFLHLEKNVGYCWARQLAINSSNTDYVSFLDADDEIMHTYVEKFYDTIQNTNYDLIFIDFYSVKNSILYKNEGVKKNICTTNKHLKKFMSFTAGWTKIINRHFLVKNNIFFIKDEKNIIEDCFFHMSLLYKANKIYYIGAEPLYKYNVFENSTSNLLIKSIKFDEIIIVNTCCFLQNNNNNKHLWIFIIRFFLLLQKSWRTFFVILKLEKVFFFKKYFLLIIYVFLFILKVKNIYLFKNFISRKLKRIIT